VARTLIFHCHQTDQLKLFVREIADTVNRTAKKEGESLRVSSETVGHLLKNMGLFTRRISNGGRGLVFDKALHLRVHELANEYEVFPAEPACGFCQQVQLTRSKELV